MELIRFKPATDYTKYIFNPWGDNPYQAVSETQVKPEGYAPVDLTILESSTGYYFFAHGAVCTHERYDSHRQATRAARNWYRDNAHMFKCSH